MNLVRLQYGGGGGELHGASVVVITNEASLANKQAYLYKKSDTSRTTPIIMKAFSDYSSGKCTVMLDGIQEVDTYYVWTTDGVQEAETDDFSVTANDIVNKTALPQLDVNFAKTYTITLYSASNDTVYYYDKNDTSREKITLAVTNSSGVASNVTFSFPANLKTIKLYSTVAKDSSDGVSLYSKTVNLSDGMANINIRPTKYLYWYGVGFDENLEITDYVLVSWSSNYSGETPNVVKNTNSFTASCGSGKMGTIFSKTLLNLSDYTKIKVIMTSSPASRPSAITTTPTKVNKFDFYTNVVYLQNTLNVLEFSRESDYVALMICDNDNITVSAILLE